MIAELRLGLDALEKLKPTYPDLENNEFIDTSQTFPTRVENDHQLDGVIVSYTENVKVDSSNPGTIVLNENGVALVFYPLGTKLIVQKKDGTTNSYILLGDVTVEYRPVSQQQSE